MKGNDFEWLMNWYHSQCDGDWEHSARIRIGTIDNPGWSISINLEDTELEETNFEEFEKENSKADWVMCFIKNSHFQGYCSPLNFLEVLQVFRKWVENHQNTV